MKRTELKPKYNWQPSFPLDNLKRYRAQSMKNLPEIPTLEEAEAILREAEQQAEHKRAWWDLRGRFARSATEKGNG